MIQGKLKKRLILICDEEKTRELYDHVMSASITDGTLIKSYMSIEEASVSINKMSPDIIILGVKFFGLTEAEFIMYVKEINPKVEFLLILDAMGFDHISNVLSTGISAIVLKNTGVVSILQAVNDVCQSGSYLSPSIARLLVESYWVNRFSPLSNRETEVLKLITQGKTYTEIAVQLQISSETSKTHIKNIYKKLNVSSKSQAVKMAINDRLISIGV